MRPRLLAKPLTEVVLALLGVALIACAVHADARWIDAHVLPYFRPSRPRQLFWAGIERDVVGAAGLALILLVRPWAGRRVAAGQGGELAYWVASTLAAVGLALLASEMILRLAYGGAAARASWAEEPLRRANLRTGFEYVPARQGEENFGGRKILYAFDPAGNRVARLGQAVDYDKPSILFAGESIMAGLHLNWADTIAAQTEALSGLQSVNLAVPGYTNAQAYLRLTAALPRFKRPCALVMLFSPLLVVRNLDRDEPWLDAGLGWHPARSSSRLKRVLDQIVPVHSAAAIDDTIARTQVVLHATLGVAEARGAIGLILVPTYLPEEPAARRLRRHVLDQARIPYLAVPLDGRWRVDEAHTDARANRALANAIAAALRAPATAVCEIQSRR